MQTVKVNKAELIGKVTANRMAHIAEFEEAHEAWVEHTIGVHKTKIKSLKETGKSGNAVFGTEPVSQEKSYNRALSMLEMSVEDVIELTEQEFTQYVMDEWSWSSAFKTVTSSYTVGR